MNAVVLINFTCDEGSSSVHSLLFLLEEIIKTGNNLPLIGSLVGFKMVCVPHDSVVVAIITSLSSSSVMGALANTQTSKSLFSFMDKRRLKENQSSSYSLL